jgi:hypothetical protein
MNVATMVRTDICVIAPVIRPAWTTAFCQGEVVSQLFRDRGHRVTTAASSWEWAEKLTEVDSALELAGPGAVAIVGVFTGENRLALVEHALTRARARGNKTIAVLRGGAIPELCQEAPDRIRRLLEQADVVASTSGYLTRAVEPLGIKPLYIGNTIRIEQYPFVARTSVRPRLLWMRAFESSVYNPELAVRVVRELLPRWPTLTLSMGGLDDGGLESTRRLAEELGVVGAVTFHDFLEMEEKRAMMRGADVFLNTNRSDNLPVSVMEAAATGMPVVCTDVGALSEIVAHEDSGLLVPSDDPVAMARATERILSDGALALSMSHAARRCAEAFDASRTFPLWANLVARAVEA